MLNAYPSGYNELWAISYFPENKELKQLKANVCSKNLGLFFKMGCSRDLW